MVANIVILVYLALMAYWWGVQGLYYAVLHLLTVILAGALALGLWEPLTVSWLLPRMPWYAWGVGLLAPFALILIVLRVTIDRVFKRNPQCGQLVNLLGGGALGLAAGVLTSGLTLIGLGFLPMGPDLAGYQPYIVTADGQVAENPESKLWVLPVDRIAGGFFERISGGSFSPMSGKSLAAYQPEMAMQAALFRLHRDDYDTHASPAATQKGVTADTFVSVPFPDNSIDVGTSTLIEQHADVALDESEASGSLRMVVVDSTWTRKDDVGTYDNNTLRVFPTQVRLLAHHRQGSGRVEARLFTPAGVNWDNPDAKRREFLPFHDNRNFPWSASESAELRWVFVIPEDYEPKALLARHLRIAIEAAEESEREDLATMVGLPGGGSGEVATLDGETLEDGGVGERRGPRTGTQASVIEVTDELPSSFNATRARGLEYNDGELLSGEATVSTIVGRQDRSCSRVSVERHLASVRLTLTRQQALTFLGEARDRAAQLGGLWLVDNRGQQWFPSGYVLAKSASQMEVKFNREMPIRSGGELPTRRMSEEDTLYLYFFVERDIRILKYQVGTSVTDVSLIVPPAGQ